MRFPLSILAGFLAVPALAMEVPEDLLGEQDRLSTEWGAPPSISVIDMNMSGIPEVLFTEDEGCGGDGCRFSLHAVVDGTWSEILSGVTEGPVRFLPTDPEGALLLHEGVTWALLEDGLEPFGDILTTSWNRAVTDMDMRVINGVEGFDDVSRSSVMAWSFETSLGGEEGIFHAAVTHSTVHMIGHWGVPWFIYDASGVVLAEGHAPDVPMVFPDVDGDGFTILERLPEGQRFIRVF